MSFFKDFFDKKNNGAGAGKTAGGHQLSIAPRPPARVKIWAIAGGKGGIGKSFLATNFGILLSMHGYRVLMVDADIGAANLHTFFGIEGSKLSLSSFLKQQISDIRPLIIKTRVPNLDLISGANDSLDIADISSARIMTLKDAIRTTDYDYVLLDIGPGTNSNSLDLFLMSDQGVLLTTPEPTSIENTYRFLKCLFLRRIRNVSNSQQDSMLKEMLHKIFTGNWNRRIKTVADILNQLRQLDPERGRLLKEVLGQTSVSLIVNQTSRPADSDLGPSLKRACYDYFGVEIGFLGDICHEDSVAESIRNRTPLTQHNSQSRAAKAIEACLQRLVDKEQTQRAVRAQHLNRT